METFHIDITDENIFKPMETTPQQNAKVQFRDDASPLLERALNESSIQIASASSHLAEEKFPAQNYSNEVKTDKHNESSFQTCFYFTA